VSAARALAAVLVLGASPAGLAGQAKLPPGRLAPAGFVPAGAPAMAFTPAFEAVAGSAPRAELSGLLSWGAEEDRPLGLRLGFGAVRGGGQSYARSGLTALLALAGAERSGLRLAVGAAGGTGQGPRRTFTAGLEGGLGSLQLGVHTNWLQTPISVGDSSADPYGLRPPAQQVETARYTDAELSAWRRVGPVAVELRAGLRFGEEARTGGALAEGPSRWLSGAMRLPVWRRLGMEGAGGWQPARPELGRLGGGFVRLGVTWELESADTVTVPPQRAALPVLDGRLVHAGVELQVRAPTASTVEVKGDLTDWRVVSLSPGEEEPGLWSVRVAGGPGVYHMSVRIDAGPWLVPAGLASVPDGFGGWVGVLRVGPR